MGRVTTARRHEIMNLWEVSIGMFLAQFSPGPDMLLLLKNAVNHPLKAGLWTIVGISLGLCLHTLVALTGLAAAFQAHPLLFRAFSLVGAAYLTYLAVRLFWAVFASPEIPAGSENVAASAAGEQPLGNFAAFTQGFLTNITNVKAFLFLASFLAVALQQDNSLGRKLACAAIIVGQALVFWSLFVKLLKLPRVRALYCKAERPLNFLFAVALLAIAVQVAWGAVGGWLPAG